MSRVGKKPIAIPQEVTAKIEGQKLMIDGPRGNLERVFPRVVSLGIETEGTGSVLKFSVNDPENKKERSLWGLSRNLAAGMIEGVTKGFVRQLEVVGIGYKVSLTGKKLKLEVGFSHPVEYELPSGIEAKVEKNLITILGVDKELVGQTAAHLRAIRRPEPYKGKGIKYLEEVVRRKAGKAAKAAAA